MRRWWRRIWRAGLVAAVVLVLAVAGSVAWVRHTAGDHIYDAETVPAASVAIVLGSAVDEHGVPRPFLAARLELAKRLYDDGKVRALLVSGDDRLRAQATAMRRWLVGAGVPAGKVVVDPAGFDTYDTCMRARLVYGVRDAIVVTQTFHLPRAVAICRSVGVSAVGVGDESVRRLTGAWRWASVREYGASVKAVLDVVSRRDPDVLGPREQGIDTALAD